MTVRPPTLLRVPVADGVALGLRRTDPVVAADGAVPFLLVHGLSSNARLWDGVAAHLAAAGHVVVAVDQRAHGTSDPSEDLDLATLVEDLATVVAATGLERPVAVGQSWGGNVALELGARRPDLVRGVAGVDGGLIDLASRFPDVAACWAALAPPSFEGLTRGALTAHLAARTAGWPDGAADAQLANFVPSTRPDERIRPVLTRERHRRIVEGLYHQRPLERLVDVTVPLLLLAVTGTDRGVIADDALAEAGRRAGGPLDVVRLPGRDHDVHLEAPGLVADLLMTWSAGGALPAAA
jgi:pimeloyl-ACP methyl ester carboxylesterase